MADFTMKRHDTDPAITYEVTTTDDGDPISLVGSTVLFSMGSKSYLPSTHSGTGDGVKSYGSITILDHAFDANDSVTLGSTEFVANDGAGGGWGVGALSAEEARDALYDEIVASSESVTVEKVSTNSLKITHDSWDEVVGNNYTFTSNDPVTPNFLLSPDTGTFLGGVTPEQIEMTFDTDDPLLEVLKSGDTVRVEHVSIDEKLTVASVDYTTGEVVFDRGDNPALAYVEGWPIWVVVLNGKSATVAGDDNNVLQYDFASGDTDRVGIFQCEFEVEKPSGKIQTYPTDSFLTLQIKPDIEDS
jgi:hypothetical protein